MSRETISVYDPKFPLLNTWEQRRLGQVKTTGDVASLKGLLEFTKWLYEKGKISEDVGSTALPEDQPDKKLEVWTHKVLNQNQAETSEGGLYQRMKAMESQIVKVQTSSVIPSAISHITLTSESTIDQEAPFTSETVRIDRGWIDFKPFLTVTYQKNVLESVVEEKPLETVTVSFDKDKIAIAVTDYTDQAENCNFQLEPGNFANTAEEQYFKRADVVEKVEKIMSRYLKSCATLHQLPELTPSG